MGLGGAALALGVVGAATAAYGEVSAGQYQAQVARNNAKIAQQNEATATTAGYTQARDNSLKVASEVGQIQADQAANNVDVNSGSAVSVRQGAQRAGEIDTATIENNALLKAYGYRQQASSQEAQSQEDLAAGTDAAASSLLSNASAVSFKWSGMNATTPSGGTSSGIDTGNAGIINVGG